MPSKLNSLIYQDQIHRSWLNYRMLERSGSAIKSFHLILTHGQYLHVSNFLVVIDPVVGISMKIWIYSLICGYLISLLYLMISVTNYPVRINIHLSNMSTRDISTNLLVHWKIESLMYQDQIRSRSKIFIDHFLFLVLNVYGG